MVREVRCSIADKERCGDVSDEPIDCFVADVDKDIASDEVKGLFCIFDEDLSFDSEAKSGPREPCDDEEEKEAM